MPSLTLTPETHLLLLTTVGLASVSPAALTERLSDVVPALRGARRETNYVVVLAAVAGAGVLLADPVLVVDPPLWRAAVSILAGLPAGMLAFRADQAVLRSYRRRRQLEALGRSGRLRQPSQVGTPVRGEPHVPSGWQLTAIGILEEVVFRGVLFSLALASGSPWVAAGLVVVVTVVFAANHVPFGDVHVVAKLPLSVLAGALTLLGGSMVGAAVAHAWFNHRVGVEADRAVRAGR